MGSKFHFSQWKTYILQFIEKLLKFEEVEYLHYSKFKTWLDLIQIPHSVFKNKT